MPVRVLIAEDKRLLRQCFQVALQSDPEIEVVGVAPDGEEALLLAERCSPDVVLMDLSMPHLEGDRATLLLRERLPGVKVIILSLHDDPAKVRAAMEAGALAFVHKEVDLAELLRIIKAAHRGERLDSPFLVDRKVAAASLQKRSTLTERERRVLALLAEGDSNHEIAGKLCISEQTVKRDLAEIFAKLGVENRTQAAVKTLELGLGRSG